MNDQEFNDILNLCLDRMFKGEPVEQCLRDYPGLAQELEPLLRTAQAAKTLSSIKPRPEFKSQARSQFKAALDQMQERKQARFSLFRWHWRWQSGWAIAAMAFFAVLVGGGSTVLAADNSMPDNTLYPVKLAAEQVQMTLTFSDMDKAELNAKLADKRVAELVYMTSKGDSERVQQVAQHLDNNLKNLNRLVGTADQNESPALQGTSPADAAPATPETATATRPATRLPMITAAVSPSASPTPAKKEGSEPPSARSARPQSGDNSAASPLQQPGNKDGERQKLKTIVTNNAAAHEAQLNAALEKAPPQVKPAVRKALDQSISEYNKAIKNLEQGPGSK
jgi:hypothetical protein